VVDCPFIDNDPIIIIESKNFLIEFFGLSSHSVSTMTLLISHLKSNNRATNTH
jgi:hypothetical protein